METRKIKPTGEVLRVPDGGWGWFVLAAAAIANFFLSGVNKSLSVIIVEVVEELGASTSEAAVIPALASFSYLVISPFTTLFCSKYEYSTVATFSALLSVAGVILSGYVRSIYAQYLCIGVLQGLGSGIMFTTGFLCVGTYFDKYKGVGNAICLAANCLGGMVMPFLLTFLYGKYGYAGAHLIIGGLLLHCFVAPLIFQPVEKHMVRVPHQLNQEKVRVELKPVPPLVSTNELEKEDVSSRNESISASSTNSEMYFAASTYNTVVKSGTQGSLEKVIKPIKQVPIFPPIQSMWNSEIIQPKSSYLSIKDESEEEDEEGEEISSPQDLKVAQLRGRRPGRIRLTSLSSVAQSLNSLKMSNTYLGSSISLLEDEAARRVQRIQTRHRFISEIVTLSEEERGMLPPDPKEVPPLQTSLKDIPTTQKKEKSFDLSILLNTKYLIILFSSLAVTLSYTNFLTLLPSFFIIELGMNKDEVNLVIALINGFDLVGRLCSALLSNYVKYPARYLYIVSLGSSGLVMLVMTLTVQYSTIATACAAIGLLSGLHIGIAPTMQGEELGRENVRFSYTLQLMAQGLISLVGPVSATLLANATGSYSLVYLVFALTLSCGGAGVFVLYPLAVKCENNKVSKQLCKYSGKERQYF